MFVILSAAKDFTKKEALPLVARMIRAPIPSAFAVGAAQDHKLAARHAP